MIERKGVEFIPFRKGIANPMVNSILGHVFICFLYGNFWGLAEAAGRADVVYTISLSDLLSSKLRSADLNTTTSL